MERTYDIFVPGRVCLFGEHSDWAGGYRRFNSSIPPGKVLLTGTNQGMRARIKPHPDSLVLRSTMPDGSHPSEHKIPMERETLLKEAQEGGFFSYAAGVAYTMLTFYHIGGIEIDNYETTLPVKKGLSSSAAFTVLVARAFNKAYDLKLTVRAEMEIAYQGEILTPSRCGRMDQGCAFGQVPVLMTFDGDLLKTQRCRVSKHIPLLIADLNGQKDTIKILADLNRAYPFATDEAGQNVQKYLGEINLGIVTRATKALENGDAEQLGRLMKEAQKQFDANLQPASPDQLASPRLHKVLADPQVKKLTFGAKGVGSQGDGCVQFVVKSNDARRELMKYLEHEYGMDSYELDLTPPQTVRKAVIPVAGFGTRMFPASKAFKKELFPIVTPDGTAKPVILAVIEEAIAAGIEEIAIIVRPGDDKFYQDFFSEPLAPEHYDQLSDEHKAYFHRLQEIGERITYITQEHQEGFGHAVYCARNWVNEEPFLLMLGDHIYVSDTPEPCARQLIQAFEANGHTSIAGVYIAPEEDVTHYGTISGTWTGEDKRVLEVSRLAEKPSTDYARQNLQTHDIEKEQPAYLCFYGQYVLTKDIFDALEKQIAEDIREAGQLQLTTALDILRKTENLLAYRVAGQHYDTGLPTPYVHTLSTVYAATNTA